MNISHTNERVLIALLVAIAISLNVFVWVGKIAQTPRGHTFIPTHNSLSDYAFYVSVIQQGMSGQISVFDRFAVEPHEGSAIHLFYLLIGWIGSALGATSAHTVYHITRYLLGALWCVTIYWLISVCVREKWVRVTAMFLALFSASMPHIVSVSGYPTVQWFMTWWSELDPVIRVAFIPHFTVGHIMMTTVFVCVLLYIQFEREQSKHIPVQTVRHRKRFVFSTWWHTESQSGKRWVVRAAVAAWIAAFVHPPSAIQLLLVLPVLMVLLRTRRSVEVGVAACFGAGMGLLIINSISRIFPWNLPRVFEGWSFALPVSDYLLALGPIVLFACIGIFFRIINYASALWHTTNRKQSLVKRILRAIQHTHHTWKILLFLWTATSICMIPLSLLMPFSPIALVRNHPISNIRFLQVAVWVPLSIFGAYGLLFIWEKLSLIGRMVLVVGVLFLTFVGYPATIEEQRSHMYFSAEYQYPDVGYISAIQALETITQPDEAIMSLSLAGMTIPTYINRSVYVGQIVYTPQMDAKLALSWKFYSGALSPCDAYALVKKHAISAVFYSFDEKKAGDAIKLYSFLQPWDSYGATQIYTVVDIPPAGCTL